MDSLGKKQQLAIGLFVVMAVASACLLVALFGENSGFKESYGLTCEVASTGGPIKKGAPVRMMGIPIGKVKSVILELDQAAPKVIIEMEIFAEYKIRSDSYLKVEQSSFIGDRVVQIYPGAQGQFLANGDKLEGKTAINIDEVILDVKETVTQLKEASKGLNIGFNNINKLIGDEKFVKDVHGSASEIHGATKDLKLILKSFKEGGEGIKEFVDNLNKSERELNQILRDVRQGKGSLGRLIEDDEFVDELEQTIKNMRRLVADLRNDPSQVFWGKEKDKYQRELTIDQITAMVKAGLKPKTIVAQIEACAQRYELDADKILELKRVGYNELVLEAMILNGR